MRKQKTAQKAHYCDCCGRRIYPKMEYVWLSQMAKGRHVVQKLHIHCDALLAMAERETDQPGSKSRFAQARHWIEDNACVKCKEHETCDQSEVYSCPNVLLDVLPGRYFAAAIKSVKELEEMEGGSW